MTLTRRLSSLPASVITTTQATDLLPLFKNENRHWSWLTMQDNHDLWLARQTINLDTVERIDFRAA